MDKKQDIYTIKISVHPAVAKWLEETAEKKDNAYDLRKSNLYFLIQSSLKRKGFKWKSHVSKKMQNYVPVYFLINYLDFCNFGYEVSDYYQCCISKFIYDMMMTDFCHHIAYAYIHGDTARDVTMKRIITEYLFEPHELTIANLSKYYYRKFKNIGREESLENFKHYTKYYLENRN